MRQAGFAILIWILGCLVSLPAQAQSENLYTDGGWSNFASDRVAREPGDILTVIVFQNAEARNSAQTTARKRTDIDAGYSTAVQNEFGNIGFGRTASGTGEYRRKESFVTSFSAVISDVFPNGNLLITGEQIMYVNGEATTIGVRGTVRPYDISKDNTIMSARIANAEINYDGQGFVTRSARAGIINWLFGFLGL